MTYPHASFAITDDVKEEKVRLIYHGDTTDVEILKNYYSFQSPLYHDARMPAFTLVSPNRKVALGIAGYVRLALAQDFNGSIPNRDFIPYQIPRAGSGSQSSRLFMDPTSSTVNIQLFAETRFGLLQGSIQTNFRGSDDANKQQKAYLQLGNVLIGSAWSILADLDCYPTSVDTQGPNAFWGITTYQISYLDSINRHITYGVSLEVPAYSIADSLSRSSASQMIPSVPFYFSYHGKWGHVRFGSLLRTLRYKNLDNGDMQYLLTWGAALSAHVQPVSPLTIYLQTSFAKGASEYFADLKDNGMDLLPNPDAPGKLRPVPCWGYYFGIDYVISKKIRVSSIFSNLRVYRGDFEDLSIYRIGRYFTASLYYKILPQLEWSFEYERGYREDQNFCYGRANRLQTAFRYDF